MLMLTMSTPMRDDLFMEEKTARIQKKARGQYHHGNLRSALIDAGLKLIAKKGVHALTLREIGSRLGVSRMAAYRHFSDKADLLGAIREAGFSLFADALEAARQKAGKSCASRLKAMALAYVRFAAAHPAYYEVMFGWNVNRAEQNREASPAGASAFGILEETIRQGQETGEIRTGNSVFLARVVWAQVHGISMLRLATDLTPLATDLTPNGDGTKFVEFSSGVLETGLLRGR
jgi:AcrR family transcriptional regulator